MLFNIIRTEQFLQDVTADFVQLVNRSSKKSADVGGFKLIHEFGNKSVYVDLPVGLILAPKDSLKVMLFLV